MLTVLTGTVIMFFAGMGLLALAAPERITAIHGTATLTPDGRNEIRAVYGGFGLAMATLLAVTPFQPQLTRGAYVAVSAALAGMAAGRLIATLVERPARFYPSWFYFTLEMLMALILLAAA